jgi:Na+-translocating ferredoxin:NAD+ oxidoreductase RNF subunit RnfB
MAAYLFPVTAITLIGLALGLILVIASKIMAVKVDERVVAIRALLPGANCGACGYPGCDGYAQALCDGTGVKTNLCAPGGAAVAAAISEVLGVSGEAVDAKIAFVKCQGNCENTGKAINYQGPQTCAAARMFYAGDGSCTYGCLGYGDCQRACAYDAICMVDGIAWINPQKCVGCGACVKACPSRIISMIPARSHVIVACSSEDRGAVPRKICKVGCWACRKCEKICPTGAISVVDNLSRIDPDKCTNCGACIGECSISHTIVRRDS